MTLSTNLISHWKLDESSGNAADSVGSNTLTNTNTFTYGTGKLSNCGTFASASSQYGIKTTATGLPSGNGAWSLSGWFNLATLPATSANMGIAEFGNTSDGTGWLFAVYNDAGTYRLAADIYGPGGPVHPAISITTGTWYYFTYTWDGTNLSRYMNGVLLSTTSSIGATQNISGGNINIGRSVGWAAYWNGSIDEVSLWSRAISPDEISQLVNSGRANAYPFTDAPSLYGCREYHKLDSDYTDATGLGNTASNTGTVITTGGIVNSCAEFSNDYIRSATVPGTDGSISVWFKYSTFGAGMVVGNTTIGTSDYLRIYPYDSTHIQYTVKDDVINATVSTFGTTWHHSVLTWSSTQAWKAYHDGSLVATGTGIKNPTNAYTIPFGVLGNAGGIWSTPFYYNGYMDEMAIFNRAITADEVSTIYNSGSGKAYPWSATTATPKGLLMMF